MESNRYMIGNLVLINNKVHRIEVITETEVTAKNISTGYISVYPWSEVKGIRLDDYFFEKNGYSLSEPYEDRHERIVTHIIPDDGYGPAVTKYEPIMPNSLETEYCLTGIIIRNIHDFQNLLNICCCPDIADKIIA